MLVGFGIFLIIAGLFLLLLSRLTGGGWRLPGDVVLRRDNVTIYIPIATSILVSVLLTILFYLLSLFTRR